MAQKHPASFFPLLLKPNGVLYADSFLLAPFQQGGASILLNLLPLIAEAGFQCGWDGWTTYDSLEAQQAWVQDNARYFSGQLPGGESRYEQKIYSPGAQRALRTGRHAALSR